MVELPKTQFGRLLPLFNPDRPHATMIYSSLEGRTPARAYVDHVELPMQCLLVTNFLNFTFFGGPPGTQWLVQTISELRFEQDLYLNWSVHQDALDDLPRRPDAVRGGLEFTDRRPLPITPIPRGHQLQLIDGALFDRCLWHDDIVIAFGSAENFLRYGIGLCLTIDREICSEAYAVWRGARRFEIGIVTAEQHRGRGYAFTTCQHLIRLCEAAGQPTCWSCFQDNTASAALARKLGYQMERADQWLHYTRMDPMMRS